MYSILNTMQALTPSPVNINIYDHCSKATVIGTFPSGCNIGAEEIKDVFYGIDN